MTLLIRKSSPVNEDKQGKAGDVFDCERTTLNTLGLHTKALFVKTLNKSQNHDEPLKHQVRLMKHFNHHYVGMCWLCSIARSPVSLAAPVKGKVHNLEVTTWRLKEVFLAVIVPPVHQEILSNARPMTVMGDETHTPQSVQTCHLPSLSLMLGFKSNSLSNQAETL